MATFILVIKIIHISAGSLALMSGLGAILSRKKISRHKPYGRFYFWCMTVIFLSTLVLASYRFSLFLLFIGIFTYHSCLTALRSLKYKKLHLNQKPLVTDWIIELTNALANAAFIIYGIYLVTSINPQEGIVSLVFGVIGLNNSRLNTQRLFGKVKNKNYWLTAHIGGMLGSYIGAITAFTVNNNRWMNLPEIVAWLGPSLVLVPLIFFETSLINNKATPKH